MSEQTHLDAVIALLGAAAVPKTLQEIKEAGVNAPARYNEVTVAQRVGSGPRRAGAPADSTQWRVLVRSVALAYADAQEMRKRASVLHEAKLTVDGETFFVERSVTDDPIGEDDGWWSGTSEFAY